MANLRRANGREAPWKVRYVAVGNESWGCGGNMRPEYYADEFRRYNTFIKNYPGNKIYRVAGGSNGNDFSWTEAVMASAAQQMNGISLHWYTLPTGNWQKKGSATDFDEAQWMSTLVHTLHMEELLTKHSGHHGQIRPAETASASSSTNGARGMTRTPGSNPEFSPAAKLPA